MIKGNNDIIIKVLDYIKLDIKNGLYIYIDIKKYGIQNENLDIWIDNEAKIGLVIMKYYSGAQIFSLNEQLEYDKIASFIKRLNVSIISGKAKIVEKLSPFFLTDEIQYGYVAQYKEVFNNIDDAIAEGAKEEDLLEIATLICQDQGLGGHYQVEELAQQFKVRRDEKFGRNKLIRFGDKIVAHAATYAELEELAIISGVVTDNLMRKKGLGRIVLTNLIRELGKEGKQMYLYYYDSRLFNFYKSLGFEICGHTGKIVKKVA